MPRERIVGNVAIIPVESSTEDPKNQFQSEFALKAGRWSGKISFSIDNLILDPETADLTADTLGLFGVLLTLAAVSRNVTGLDLVTSLRRHVLSHLLDQPDVQLEEFIASLDVQDQTNHPGNG